MHNLQKVNGKIFPWKFQSLYPRISSFDLFESQSLEA